LNFSGSLGTSAFFGLKGLHHIIYWLVDNMAERGMGRIKEYPLSDSDIKKILGQDIKIITYPMLGEMNSIDEAFDAKGRCIMLYLTESSSSGHWCCLLKKGNTIEFFDPYGEPPEEALDNVPQSKLQQLDEGRPYLTDLLRASGKKVSYNHHPFQQTKNNVNTCGRHSVVRCLYAPYSLAKYKKVMDASGMTPDNFVSALTALKLGK